MNKILAKIMLVLCLISGAHLQAVGLGQVLKNNKGSTLAAIYVAASIAASYACHKDVKSGKCLNKEAPVTVTIFLSLVGAALAAHWNQWFK